MDSVAQALWLFLPAALANATPVFASRVYILRGWNRPIDGGRSFRGKRVLGNNKTWRGMICGVIIAGFAGYLQHWLWPDLLPVVLQVLWAVVIGFGALYGDAAESFFKRQLGYGSGQTWFPFDQLDYIAGGLIAAVPFQAFDAKGVAAIIGAYFVLHVMVTYLGFLSGFREQPI